MNYLKCILQPPQIIDFLIVGEFQRDEALPPPRKDDNYHQGGHKNIEFSSPNISPTVDKDDRTTQCYNTSGSTTYQHMKNQLVSSLQELWPSVKGDSTRATVMATDPGSQSE